MEGEGERKRAQEWAVAIGTLFVAIDAVVELIAPDGAESTRFVALVGALATLVALHRMASPRSDWLVRAAIVAAIATIGIEAIQVAPTVPSASPLVFLGVIPFFVILVAGFRSLIASGFLCLATIAWAAHHVPFEGRYVSTSLSNLALTALVGIACATIHEAHARRLRHIANTYASERRSELELAQSLSGMLFSEFRGPLERISAALSARDGFDRDAIAREAAALREILARGRAKVLERKTAVPLPRLEAREDILRARIVVPMLLTLALGAALSLARDAGYHRSPVAPLVVIGIAAIALIASHREPAVPRRALATITMLLSASLLVAHHVWGFASDSPTLVTQPVLTFVAYAIAGPVVATTVALLVAVDIFMLVRGLPARTAVEAVSTVVTASWFAVAACWLYWRALRLEIASAERNAHAYESATRQRYRLMTTFFHDEGNLLMPLGLIAGTKQVVPDAEATLREIVERMVALLDAVRSIYENEDPIGRPRDGTISIGRVFDGIELLFGERVGEKGQRLLFDGDRRLVVHAMPALLVDSVLSNLVSNAIKFTPAGGTVRVAAMVLSPERVALTVRDDGPGMPPELVARLDRAERLPSTAGTAGEAGHGFGLVLAKDFSRRMGGTLRIRRPPDPGTEVVVDFPGGSPEGA